MRNDKNVKRIAYSKDALKTLMWMPANVAKLIRSKIEQYAANPALLANNVKALRGEAGIFRLRVDDWRVLFNENGEVIAIIQIAPRGGAYG
jgi:mRNA interferase RelE/StbE